MTIDLRTGICDVRQNARWPEKYIVFDDHSCVNGHVVLNFDIIPDDRPRIDIHVLTKYAPLTYPRSLHHVRTMPDLRARSDLGTLVDIRGFVREVGRPLFP